MTERDCYPQHTNMGWQLPGWCICRLQECSIVWWSCPGSQKQSGGYQQKRPRSKHPYCGQQIAGLSCHWGNTKHFRWLKPFHIWRHRSMSMSNIVTATSRRYSKSHTHLKLKFKHAKLFAFWLNTIHKWHAPAPSWSFILTVYCFLFYIVL